MEGVAYRRICNYRACGAPRSRLQVQGLPSVASPFAGGERSLDARLFPAHPPPYDGYLSLRALKDQEPQARAPRTSVQEGTYAASARLHGCRTTAGMQELEQRRSGCRGRAAPGAVAEGRTGAACARKPRGCPCSALVSAGPRQGLSSRPLSLRRSKARGSPSVASPFGGITVHRTVIFSASHPCAWGERGGPCLATSCLHFALPPPAA